ncbi:hypothetical protein ACEPAH_355 [Sanghuangporus vaninii]
MASPGAGLSLPPQDKWPSPDAAGAPLSDPDIREPSNGAHLDDDGRSAPPLDSAGDYRPDVPPTGGHKPYREKQVKPNKVYIGGLPEHTTHEDLRTCFGEIGKIINTELKLGYGFVEFDTQEAAEESVAKYDGGTFMGKQIRVEMSHGGGRTAKYHGDPGACFKCGQSGHWARECPNHSIHGAGPRRPGHYADPRDYPPPPRDYPYRDDYGRYPSGRDPRYSYDYPPPPSRDYRRPLTPPREYRDYPAVTRPPRDYDDYRMRPPPGPPRPYYPNDPPYSRYEAPPRDIDRGLDRRGPPPPSGDRYPPYSGAARPRTPPGPPPLRVRDDYEKIPPRDYPASDYRGRPTTPPVASRYGEYPPRTGGSDASVPRYRRRSQSPPPRSSGSNYRPAPYASDHGSDAAGYPTPGAPFSASVGYTGNGYSAGPNSAPSRSGGSTRDREFSSRSDAEPTPYSRRA